MVSGKVRSGAGFPNAPAEETTSATDFRKNKCAKIILLMGYP
jgi:hypothetical protein